MHFVNFSANWCLCFKLGGFMNQILADIQPTQWILLAIIVVLIILYPIFVYIRNKKDREKFQALNDSLKVGDKVVTGAGVYGTIISIDVKNEGKIVTLETGDENHKGYVSVDVLAIYNVINDTPIQETTEALTTTEIEKSDIVEENSDEKQNTEMTTNETKQNKTKKK